MSESTDGWRIKGKTWMNEWRDKRCRFFSTQGMRVDSVAWLKYENDMNHMMWPSLHNISTRLKLFWSFRFLCQLSPICVLRWLNADATEENAVLLHYWRAAGVFFNHTHFCLALVHPSTGRFHLWGTKKKKSTGWNMQWYEKKKEAME